MYPEAHLLLLRIQIVARLGFGGLTSVAFLWQGETDTRSSRRPCLGDRYHHLPLTTSVTGCQLHL